MFVIKKIIKISAPISRVFSALTTSNEILAYYPLKEVNSEWVLGSQVLYKGEDRGVPFIDFGVIEKIQSLKAISNPKKCMS
jgi:uncharacterized protein YndB with AHSA1/START domain